MKKTILLIPLAMAATFGLHAQSIGPSTLNAAGGSAIIGSNEFDWSVGEMTMVSTFTASNVIITQGLLQPTEDKTSVPNTTPLLSHFQVFPNPASSLVNLQYTSAGPGTLAYRLLDLTGKVVLSHEMAVRQGANNEQIDLTNYACASYFLEVTIHSGSVKPEVTTYKIQKIK